MSERLNGVLFSVMRPRERCRAAGLALWRYGGDSIAKVRSHYDSLNYFTYQPRQTREDITRHWENHIYTMR
jgi:hypothetical protein